jgi:hypothetical protein
MVVWRKSRTVRRYLDPEGWGSLEVRFGVYHMAP